MITLVDASMPSADANRLPGDRRTRMEAIFIKAPGGNERNLNFDEEQEEKWDDGLIKRA